MIPDNGRSAIWERTRPACVSLQHCSTRAACAPRINKFLRLVRVAILVIIIAQSTPAQSTQFTYQGKLTDGGTPASGNFDLQFKLFDAATLGIQQGTTATVSGVVVAAGIFTVSLDFGAAVFTGPTRFLEINVRPAGGGAFTLLSPRQPLTSTPYAIKSLNSTTADGLSLACVNCVTSSQINSVSGSQVSGVIPVASLPSGSPSYVQNTSTQQTGASFNISGTGTANILNAATQFNLNGDRILSGPANTSNFFAGVGAGQANTSGDANSYFGYGSGSSGTTGNFNAFFGQASGFSNTTGSNNSFFGGVSGLTNTTGFNNSFFGSGSGNSNINGFGNAFFGESSGSKNTSGAANSFFGEASGKFSTTGDSNAFFGFGTGSTNTTGSNNTLIGNGANVGANNLTFATAIGSGSLVSASNTLVIGRNSDAVQIPGSLGVTGGTTFGGTVAATLFETPTQYNIAFNRVLTVNGLGNTNTFLGVQAGNANPTGNFNSFFGNGSGKSTTTGGNNSFFGSGSGGSNQSGSDNSYFGRNSGFGSTGSQNSFFGSFSGVANSGSRNSFFGYQAGNANTFGNDNSFFGLNSGSANTTGNGNSFFGNNSGEANTFGIFNAFFGMNAGHSNTEGNANSFFGQGSGASNSQGGFNSFFGNFSGGANTNGSNNSFFGRFSGDNNTGGNNGTFVGFNTGLSNTVENNNTFVGSTANGVAGISNATAIGAQASVTQSNALVLGSISGVNFATSDTNVGIGTTAPQSRLHLNGNAISFAVTLTNSANSAGRRGYRLAFDNDRFTFQRADDSGNFAANQVSIDQATGNVGIGTVSPDRTLTVNGTADKLGGGSWDVFSDERLKTIKGSFVPGLASVMQLQPVRYEYKPDNALGLHSAGEHIGFGAQSVQKVIPEAVSQNEKGYLLVNNDPILWTMLNAIKEQQAMIETLQQENRKLKTRNAQTETRIKAIEISVRRMSQVNRRHRKVR